jgi:oxygen-independent coproporphyrinogen-3 oxidase
MAFHSPSSAAEPPWLWPRAAYVHVPFCKHHCGYCDFAVVAGRDDLIDQYIGALGKELKTLERPQLVDTLFLGGGTPTHLAPPALARLLAAVRQWLPLEAGHEFTVEANPATLDADKIAVLAEAGVNRVSLGAQSFHGGTLKVLERDHLAVDIREAVRLVRKRIDNVSLDLIFGVPGQSVEAWKSDVSETLDLGIDHVSTYGLTYEKGTRLWKDRERGQVTALGEEDELAMYLVAMEIFESAGLDQYEISSFARPGRRCRHNQVYWANHAYFGFGLGAARYVQGRRETNTRDLLTYLRKVTAGESCVMQSEKLEGKERALETLSLNLRGAEGIVRQEFESQTGFTVYALVGEAIGELCEQGVLNDDGQRIRLTRRGKCVADAVVSRLLRQPQSG